ncbi:MAG: type IV pilin N-terminal domain-containing protein [Candidatus Methanoperedens sp.]
MSKFVIKKPRNILRDENAVSPMIATIMLIAVVVILGAVIGASSMKSASKMDTSTNAVSLAAVQTGAGIYNITLTDNGGDSLPTNMLTFSVTVGAHSVPQFMSMNSSTFGATNPIIAPTTDPGTFTAGSAMQIAKDTNSLAPITANTYHVVVRYNSQTVLLDTPVVIS